MNISKSKSESEPTWTTGSHRTNQNLLLSLNNSSWDTRLHAEEAGALHHGVTLAPDQGLEKLKKELEDLWV